MSTQKDHATCHPFGAQNLQEAHRFLENCYQTFALSASTPVNTLGTSYTTPQVITVQDLPLRCLQTLYENGT